MAAPTAAWTARQSEAGYRYYEHSDGALSWALPSEAAPAGSPLRNQWIPFQADAAAPVFAANAQLGHTAVAPRGLGPEWEPRGSGEAGDQWYAVAGEGRAPVEDVGELVPDLRDDIEVDGAVSGAVSAVASRAAPAVAGAVSAVSSAAASAGQVAGVFGRAAAMTAGAVGVFGGWLLPGAAAALALVADKTEEVVDDWLEVVLASEAWGGGAASASASVAVAAVAGGDAGAAAAGDEVPEAAEAGDEVPGAAEAGDEVPEQPAQPEAAEEPDQQDGDEADGDQPAEDRPDEPEAHE